MLPNYIPPTFTLTRHIHLGAVPMDGSAPVGFGDYGEPPYKFGRVKDRTPHFSSIDAFEIAQDGTPYDHALWDADMINPVMFTDYEYNLRVNQSELDVLMRLYKRRVYLVDSVHCTDSADHAPYVKTMYFAELTHDENVTPLLSFIRVTVLFKDMNTVAPV